MTQEHDYTKALDKLKHSATPPDYDDWLATIHALKIAQRLQQEPSEGMITAGRDTELAPCCNAEEGYKAMVKQMIKEIE